MQKVQAHDDESGSGSGSGVSDLSNIDDGTDTLGRAILRHERDVRRMQSVLEGAQRHFDHNMSRPSLTQRLQQHAVKEPERQSPAHKQQREVEPGLNVPRAWARKTRAGRDWTRHSKIPVTSEIAIRPRTTMRVEEDAPVLHRTAYASDDDWQAGDNELQPDPEDTPPSMRRRRPLSQPTSLRYMNARLRDIVKADSDDLTNPTLLTSTPAAIAPAPVKRHVRVSTRAAHLRRTLAENRATVQKNDTHDAEQVAESSSDKENVPQAANRKTATIHTESIPVAVGVPFHPAELHQGSLIKMKQSTRTTEVHTSHNQTGNFEELQQELKHEPHLEVQTPLVTGRWVDTPVIDRINADLPELRGLQRSTSSSVDAAVIAAPPEHKNSRLALAEIIPRETDALSRQLSETISSSSEKMANTNERTYQPASPPGKADSKNGSIVDLPRLPQIEKDKHQELLTTEAQPRLPQIEIDKYQEVLTTEAQPRMTQNEKDKRQEVLASEALSKHIQKALTIGEGSIAPITLKDQPSQVVLKKPVIIRRTPSNKSISDHNGMTHCVHCGGAYTSVWRGLWYEFRSNFWTVDPTSFTGIRVTKLGALLITWLCWYILESLLCERYCQPKYASYMVGTGVDPDAPRFPFVIPTLIFKPFEFASRPVIQWLQYVADVAFERAIGDATTDNIWPPSEAPGYISARTGLRTRYAYKVGRRPMKWVATAGTFAASSSKRIVESAIDAVDDTGRLLE